MKPSDPIIPNHTPLSECLRQSPDTWSALPSSLCPIWTSWSGTTQDSATSKHSLLSTDKTISSIFYVSICTNLHLTAYCVTMIGDSHMLKGKRVACTHFNVNTDWAISTCSLRAPCDPLGEIYWEIGRCQNRRLVDKWIESKQIMGGKKLWLHTPHTSTWTKTWTLSNKDKNSLGLACKARDLWFQSSSEAVHGACRSQHLDSQPA